MLTLFLDYTTANGPTVSPALNDTQKASLYAELASGAESGWDYTFRWFSAANVDKGLLALNVRNTVGVDLNSILCKWQKPSELFAVFDAHSEPIDKNHVLMASLYGSANASAVSRHNAAAESLREAILDLFWDSQKVCILIWAPLSPGLT